MDKLVQSVLNSGEKADLGQLLSELSASGKKYFLKSEILLAFIDYCQQSEKPRYLENKLQEDIKLAGLDFLHIQPQVVILTRLIPNCEGTNCNLRLEKIESTQNGWILRVPFQDSNSLTQNWISKFEIWPYLENFALDAEKELLQLGGRPNLIIGNYTDGNLVAFLLARRLKVIHCNIAHPLEKPFWILSINAILSLYTGTKSPNVPLSAFANNTTGVHTQINCCR